LLLTISYCMLSLHIITFQGYFLRSNINKTKHQILLKQTIKPLRSGGQIGDICAAHQKSLTGRESVDITRPTYRSSIVRYFDRQSTDISHMIRVLYKDFHHREKPAASLNVLHMFETANQVLTCHSL